MTQDEVNERLGVVAERCGQCKHLGRTMKCELPYLDATYAITHNRSPFVCHYLAYVANDHGFGSMRASVAEAGPCPSYQRRAAP